MRPTPDKEIYLIRHGSLPEECRLKLVGQSDTPLSERGIAEAAAAGRFLREIAWDAVFSGTLTRVTTTLRCAALANPALTELAVYDPRLNEVDFGDWNFKDLAELTAAESAILSQWNLGNFDFAFPGGETMGAFAERTRAAWRDIVAAPGRTIAVFAHGGVIMGLLADIVGNSRAHAFDLWVERGALARTRICSETGRGSVNLIGRPGDWGF